MVPYRYDPEHIAPANAAPRCQHIKLNGQRCGAPALRAKRHCHFHDRIQERAMAEDVSPFLPFVEDATSLQFALMRVMRLLQIGHSIEYKRCALLLYSLQIAASNLKAFMAEQPKTTTADCEQPQPVNGEDKNDGDHESASTGPATLREALGWKGELASPLLPRVRPERADNAVSPPKARKLSS